MHNIFRSAARRADADAAATLRAVTRSQAVIEFSPDGIILSANDNFLGAMGYDAAEIVGKHHRLFVDPGYAASPDYAAFWDHLRGGQFGTGEYKRFGKGQREVWIQASYNPVTDETGKVVKIVKFAADITTQKLASLDAQQQLAALSRSQAVIEFTLGGEIINANDNFLAAMGYRLDEIRGKHHAMFVDPSYAASPEYKAFWPALAKGEFKSGEFRRLGKGGREVWIQASYNPIFDADGRPFKVVKTAADITARKRTVETLGSGLEKLAGGDLSFRLETPFPGELEPVRHAFNHTVERFAGIVGNLRTTSSLLRTATGEILSGANDLADRTTKQAAAIEQTSAAMEVLTETVSKNAASADAAHGRTQQLATTAEQVGSVMRQSNDAMQRISDSSAKISSIIGLIDDIAFQTNLLALNASVEAARAGDAGKGFAVVAIEVRRLAQSAASASADIKALIEQSGGEVANGNRLVAEAAAKLDDVLAGMRESAGLVEGIAQATREQTGSISEVRTAIRQMDEMTQHNAALVEETNAAIEQTEGQASELDKIVDSFVLSTTPRQALPRRRFAADGNAAIAADWDDL